jgi:hypothetical protein
MLFGWALAAGDWDQNGDEDLAVSAIGKNSGAANSGRVYIYFADTTSHAIRTSATPLILNPPLTVTNEYFGTAILVTHGKTSSVVRKTSRCNRARKKLALITNVAGFTSIEPADRAQ